MGKRRGNTSPVGLRKGVRCLLGLLVRVFRGMRAAEDGLPEVGGTGRYLGVRPDIDVPVDGEGQVEPGVGGMSVVPPPVTNLAPHRLPRQYGGRSNDPVFELETGELPDALVYRPDPDDPEGHGFVEPARRMYFEEYERAVHETRGLWRPVG